MAAQDAGALFQSIVELGRRVFGAAACSLATLEPDDEHLVFRAASGAGADEVTGLRLPVSRGIAGWVVSSGQPISVSDVRADPRFAVDVAESTGYVPRSILAAPITAGGEPMGVLEVLDRRESTGGDDLELLVALGFHAGLVAEAADRMSGPAPSAPEPGEVLARVARLGAQEQRVAAGLLTELLTYLERRGGPAGLV